MSNTQIGYYYCVNNRSELSDFIFKHWRLYDKKMDGHSTQAEFADYLGIKKSTLSHLKTGRRENPELDTVQAIYKATGDLEIYRITGYEKFIPKPPTSTELMDKVESLPSEDKFKLFSAIRESLEIMEARGISIDSPEGVEILNSARRKHGL